MCAGVARPRQSPSAIATIRRDLTLHRALRRMAGLVFLLVFRVLAGACQRHGVGGFLVQFIIITIRRDLPCHVTIWAFWVAISAPRAHSPTKKR